jgi:uncharacterized damage-inducible protein DinB
MKESALAFLLVMATTASPLRAQGKSPQGLTPQPNQTDSALTAETRHVFQSVSENVLKAARQMPEASYSFKPTSGVRTFGQLIAHIANVQATLCGNINGHPPATAGGQASKDNEIKELQASVGECEMAFAELSAENATKMVQTPTGQLTHMAALVYIISHASEEYGQLGVYLRLNHLIPPTSDEARSLS